MRKFIFAGLFASIFFIPAVAQENSVGSSRSAASVGVASEVGVFWRGLCRLIGTCSSPHYSITGRYGGG